MNPDASKRRILVISDDIMPQQGVPGRAAGIRAWELGEALRAHGFHVHYAVRTSWWPQDRPIPPCRPFESYWCTTSELQHILSRTGCDVVLNCSYPSLLPRSAYSLPIIQDSHGPRLLEGIFRQPKRMLNRAWKEAIAYASADYFVCAGEYQLRYFYPWLMLSGFNVLDRSRIAVVPIGFAEAPPERAPVPGRIIFGGSLLPWTDPRIGWQATIDEVDSIGGEFILFVQDRQDDLSVEFLREELRRIARSPRCRVIYGATRDSYLNQLSSAAAAIDVMRRNCERELAFPTRTAEYLWAGVPTIIHDFSEVAHLIAKYDAGWVVSPSDIRGMRLAIRQAINNVDVVVRKSQNARRLHNDVLHPARAVLPLATMCQSARKRDSSCRFQYGRVRMRLVSLALRLSWFLAGIRSYG
jgi:glycosyltransferase involved in cell wall biosynthesis